MLLKVANANQFQGCVLTVVLLEPTQDASAVIIEYICKCQYWPPEDPGVNTPAFCTGYYTGGTSGFHHWACCNNCNDSTNTCDGDEWQGGSTKNYCGECGQNEEETSTTSTAEL